MNRAGSPPSSEAEGAGEAARWLRFLNAEGGEVDAPREWEPARVELLIDPARWDQFRLLRQGEELPLSLRKIGAAPRVVADWPRSGTGRYRLELLAGNAPAAEPHVATVRPRKLSGEQYAQLLSDLETLPGAVALSLQRLGALSGVKLLPPALTTLAAEAARLRRAAHGHAGRPGLLTVLPRLAADPHRVLRALHEWVPRNRARRPSPALLVASITRAHNLGRDGLPGRVPDTRVEHSVDVYENRVVKTFYEQVLRRLRRLMPALAAARQTNVYDEMRLMGVGLRRARLQATFLDHVGELSQPPTRLTMVLLKRPAYRAALEGLLELHRSAWARLESPALESPLENLPTLYQHWGALQVFHAALEAAAAAGFEIREQTLARREPGGVFIQVLPDGLTTIHLERPGDGASARLIVERSYTGGGDLRSASYEQRPDVALEVYSPGGGPRVYLFDPKYKLVAEEREAERSDGRPKKEDLDKMHAYRDAIRDAAGRHVVEYAAVMYPGSEGKTYGEGLEALSSLPGSSEALGARLRDILSGALA